MPEPDPDALPVPAMDHEGGFKDSQYSVEMGLVILQRMAAGETIRRIAADPAMPSYATIFHWRKLHPDFARDWEKVRMLQAYLRVERWEAKAKLPPGAWRRGRKSSFTVERGEAVCALLREGVTMMAINAMPGMPSAKVVYTWLKREPVFREMVAEARAYGEDWLRFKAEIAAERVLKSFPAPCPDFPAIRAETEYWEGRAGAFRPKVYGRFRT